MISCPACATQNAVTSRFCAQCGAALPGRASGPVVDGVWQRAPGEFVRRVTGDQLRSAFAGLAPGFDLDGFLQGSLAGKVVDAFLTKTIRVPPGSVGVVMRDGACIDVLPPGEQTTASLLKGSLAERGEKVLGVQRTTLYLVDRRPIPIVFSQDIPGKSGLVTVEVRALLSPGAGRAALAAFLGEVVGDRDAFLAEDLHARLRPEVEQAVRAALSRTTDLAAAERDAKKNLEARALSRTGLELELLLAPKHTVHRLDLALGGAVAGPHPCATCKKDVLPGQRFCMSCGAPQSAAPGGDALLARDGAAVELDVTVSTQGDTALSVPRGLLVAAAAKWLRDRDLADVPAALASLESALSAAIADALVQSGQRLLTLSVVDVRSSSGEWALGARAAMAQARVAVTAGRAWLDVRGDEQALETLTLASVLEEQRIHRDHDLQARQAKVDDARRHAALDAAERELRREQRDAEHTDALSDQGQRHERERLAASQRADLTRDQLALDSERKRQIAEDDAHGDRLRREARLDELRALAAIDADLTDREQRHRVETMSKLEGKSEAQMLAMQATDLASKEHGAAFAAALGQIADGDAARHERERADARIDAKDERVMRLMEKLVAAKEPPPSCKRCGALLPVAAKFCGACGTVQG